MTDAVTVNEMPDNVPYKIQNACGYYKYKNFFYLMKLFFVLNDKIIEKAGNHKKAWDGNSGKKQKVLSALEIEGDMNAYDQKGANAF